MLKQIGLQITNSCNGRCVMCDQRLSSRPVRHMTPEELKKIVNEIQELKIGSRAAPTGVCGIAEALCHPGFSEMISIVRVIPWCFGTNCQALTPKNSEIVLNAKPCVVSLSVDAATPEVMKMMRPTMKFQTVVRNAELFIEETKKRASWDRQFFIQYVVTKLNAHEVQKWVDYWLPKVEGISGFRLHVKPVSPWPRIQEVDQFWPSPVPNVKTHPQIQVDDFRVVSIRDSCRLLWDFAWLMSDGAYSPCCMCSDDVFKIGNVFESGIQGCYNSTQLRTYQEIFRQKRYKELPLCGSCR